MEGPSRERIHTKIDLLGNLNPADVRFGDGGLDSGLAWFGVLGNIVLALSLFRLGRARGWTDR